MRGGLAALHTLSNGRPERREVHGDCQWRLNRLADMRSGNYARARKSNGGDCAEPRLVQRFAITASVVADRYSISPRLPRSKASGAEADKPLEFWSASQKRVKDSVLEVP
jgi:hypothetical protein